MLSVKVTNTIKIIWLRLLYSTNTETPLIQWPLWIDDQNPTCVIWIEEQGKIDSDRKEIWQIGPPWLFLDMYLVIWIVFMVIFCGDECLSWEKPFRLFQIKLSAFCFGYIYIYHTVFLCKCFHTKRHMVTQTVSLSMWRICWYLKIPYNSLMFDSNRCCHYFTYFNVMKLCWLIIWVPEKVFDVFLPVLVVSSDFTAEEKMEIETIKTYKEDLLDDIQVHSIRYQKMYFPSK